MSISAIGRPSAADFAANIVKKLDTNADGSVDKNEFVTGLTAKGVSADEAARQFDKIDTKKTGAITQADLETAIKANAPKQAPPPGGKGGGGPAPAGASDTKTYDPMDTNQDGTVSAQEELVYQLTHSDSTAAVKTSSASTAVGNNVDTTA